MSRSFLSLNTVAKPSSRTVKGVRSLFNGLEKEVFSVGAERGARRNRSSSPTAESPRMRNPSTGRFMAARSPARKSPPLMMAEAPMSALDLERGSRPRRASRSKSHHGSRSKSRGAKRGPRSESPAVVSYPRRRSPAPQAAAPMVENHRHKKRAASPEVEKPRRSPRAASPTVGGRRRSPAALEVENRRHHKRSPLMTEVVPARGVRAAAPTVEKPRPKPRGGPKRRSSSRGRSAEKRGSKSRGRGKRAEAEAPRSAASSLLGALFL
jgi:hypothetical protein